MVVNYYSLVVLNQEKDIFFKDNNDSLSDEINSLFITQHNMIN